MQISASALIKTQPNKTILPSKADLFIPLLVNTQDINVTIDLSWKKSIYCVTVKTPVLAKVTLRQLRVSQRTRVRIPSGAFSNSENGKHSSQRQEAGIHAHLNLPTFCFRNTCQLPLCSFRRKTMYYATTAFHNFYEPTVILFLNLNIFLLTQRKMDNHRSCF